MKVLVEKEIGGDGAKASLVINGGNLEAQVTYPLAKVLEPANQVIDKAFAAIEAAIPGDWDKALLEPIKVMAKAELLSLVSE